MRYEKKIYKHMVAMLCGVLIAGTLISGYQDSGNDGFICTRFDTEQIEFIPETVIENNHYN
ncbi:hypothetical protein [Lacrimispora sp.]|uniref:hypothetical protein n=1 Tax=Lacrimispora sp. TaxID=2719234 RepID=UPI0028AC0FCC|nr:hypothetical protein [Lacrimispora sp.]